MHPFSHLCELIFVLFKAMRFLNADGKLLVKPRIGHEEVKLEFLTEAIEVRA